MVCKCYQTHWNNCLIGIQFLNMLSKNFQILWIEGIGKVVEDDVFILSNEDELTEVVFLVQRQRHPVHDQRHNLKYPDALKLLFPLIMMELQLPIRMWLILLLVMMIFFISYIYGEVDPRLLIAFPLHYSR